jgi:hypothetical protein
VESKVESYEKDLQRELNRIKQQKEDEDRAKNESALSLKERQRMEVVMKDEKLMRAYKS